MRPLFITFEGIDGCGKSTQLNHFVKKLRQSGYGVKVTREPGGTAVSEAIREIILSRKHTAMSAETELLLYLAARAQNTGQIILPALEKGLIVVSDRYFDSTLAYQGGGRRIPVRTIRKLNSFACRGLVPDLTFLLDIPAAEAEQRRFDAGKRKDRLEAEGLRFLENVRRSFLRLAEKEPHRIIILDARLGIRELKERVWIEWKQRQKRKSQKS